jgi:hypothetical protein
MGRTIPTFTCYLDNERASWASFRRALTQEDRASFDQLFRYARRQIAAASCATRAIPFEALVMAILLEQQKEIERLKASRNEASHNTSPRQFQLIPVLSKVSL